MTVRQEHRCIARLKSGLAEGAIDRREFLRSATLLGLSAGAAYAFADKLAGRPMVAAARAAMPRGGTLRLGMRLIDVSSPHTFSWVWDSNIARQVTDYLTRTGPDNITRPCLLDKWAPSDDLKTWTLHLRRDVKWHNGRQFVADDVVWNLRQVLDPQRGSSVLGLMTGYMMNDAGTDLWDANAIEKLDDFTVQLNCRSPQLAVPEHLFHYPLLIIDPEEGGDFAPGSNGTGGFDLVSYEIGKKARLKGRSDYWGDGPFVDWLEFVDLGDDPTGEIDAMASRDLHGIDIADIIQIDAFKLMSHLDMYEVVTASTAVLRGKVAEKPFDDLRVRQAMRLAIDCTTIQQLVHGDHGVPAEHHHVSPVHPEYANLPLLARDLAKARSLLAEAGYDDGIDLGNVVCSNSPSWQFNAVQAMTEQWKEAGIRAGIDLLPAKDFWEVWDKVKLGFTGWVHRPLGVMALGLGYRSGVPWNESGFSDARFDRLLLEAEGLLDVEARRVVMAEIQRLLQEEGPIVQPLWRSEITFMDRRVKGFTMHPSTCIFGHQLAIEV